MDEEIKCLNCNSAEIEQRNFFDEQNEKIFCKTCGSSFPVIHDTRYAIADTGSWHYFIAEEGQYRHIFFENPIQEKIAEISRLYSLLPAVSTIAAKILPISKLCHDLVKDRIRETLLYNPLSQLTSSERDELALDPNSLRLNLEKLIFEKISIALPSCWVNFQVLADAQKQLILELQWLRNKAEHIALSKWPQPAYVHTDTKAKPEDVSNRILNKLWLKSAIFETIGFLNEFQKVIGIDSKNLYRIDVP